MQSNVNQSSLWLAKPSSSQALAGKRTSDGRSWSPASGCWRRYSDGQIYIDRFSCTRDMKRGKPGQGRQCNRTSPVGSLLTVFHIYKKKKKNSSSVSFWTSIFSRSEVKISTHLYCILHSPEHNFLYCKKKKNGERKENTRIELKCKKHERLSREAGDKVA